MWGGWCIGDTLSALLYCWWTCWREKDALAFGLGRLNGACVPGATTGATRPDTDDATDDVPAPTIDVGWWRGVAGRGGGGCEECREGDGVRGGAGALHMAQCVAVLIFA